MYIVNIKDIFKIAIAEDKEKINLAIAEYEMESIEDDSKSYSYRNR